MAMNLRATSVFLACSLLASALPPSAAAQTPELYIEGEVVSQYFWRGTPLSSSLNFQPLASLILDAVDLSVFSSWGVDGYKEVDLSIGFSRELPKGSLYLTVNDYFFAADGVSFGDFGNYGGVEDGEPTGAHTVELVVEYSGPEEFPVRTLFARNVWGDPDGSWYWELGADLAAGAFAIAPVLGTTLNASPYYYEVDSATVMLLGVTVSRDLFSFGERVLYASGAAYHNPDVDETYWVFALGF